jgi:hypothetical protein
MDVMDGVQVWYVGSWIRSKYSTQSLYIRLSPLGDMA